MNEDPKLCNITLAMYSNECLSLNSHETNSSFASLACTIFQKVKHTGSTKKKKKRSLVAVCSWIFLGLTRIFCPSHFLTWEGKPTCVHNCRNFYNVVSWFFSSCHFCSAIVTLHWSGADRQQRSGITAWCNLPTSPKSNPWCRAPSGEAAGTISIISALTRPGERGQTETWVQREVTNSASSRMWQSAGV